MRHDCYAICDEVYEHIVFDGRRHVPLMTLPGMRERAVRIGSAGKTFSLTGWKVGYVTAAPALLEPITKAHQFTTFTTPPNFQKAVAYGLAKDDAYYAALAGDLQTKRDRFAAGLRQLGLGVAPCEGTYFITADVASLGLDASDAEICKRMTVEAGVAAVPASAFYQDEGPETFVRFCFSKQDEILDAAIERLGAWIDGKASTGRAAHEQPGSGRGHSRWPRREPPSRRRRRVRCRRQTPRHRWRRLGAQSSRAPP